MSIQQLLKLSEEQVQIPKVENMFGMFKKA